MWKTKSDTTTPDTGLEAVLAAREARAARTRALRLEHRSTVISFKLNLPGARKSHTLADLAFQEGMDCITRQMKQCGRAVLESSCHLDAAGWVGFLAVEGKAEQTKRLAVIMEEEHPLGRLFDIDVIACDGEPISRAALGFGCRTCFICGGPVWSCARSRRHPVQELAEYAERTIRDFLTNERADDVAAAATRALLYEVTAAPKPGLVDRLDTGAHDDMDIFTFIDSASALTPYFRNIFLMGASVGVSPDHLLERGRYLGREAESRMLAATGSVNTHKGAVFSLGLLCLSAGGLFAAGQACTPDALLERAAAVARGTLCDFDGPETVASHGMEAYRAERATGVRGEAAAGYPTVRCHGYPLLKCLLAEGVSAERAGIAVLISMMAHTADTNVLHRAGAKALRRVQAEAARLAGLDIDELIQQAHILNREFTAENISPGGVADLLAVTFFLHLIDTGEKAQQEKPALTSLAGG